MGGMLRRKHSARAFLGIDISAARIKLLELDGKLDAIRVASYACEPLPAHAVVDHQIINVDAVGNAIGRALKKSGSRNRNAAIGVSDTAVISKTITMPAEMSNDEIEQQLLFDAPQHIPYPIENVSLDFQVLGPNPANNARNQVLLVACRRDNIEMRSAVLEVAGLRPKLVDVEEYALRNAYPLLYGQMPNNGHNSTVAIFEIGAQRTRLDIQHDRHSVHSREQAFGGQRFADGLIKRFGLENDEQLSAQLRNGQITSEDIDKPLNEFCDQASHQIEGALQFYFSTDAASKPVDQILLTGGCTLYPQFEKRIQERLSCPTACADPLANIRIGDKARRNHIEHDGPTLMVAAGLSIRTMM